jgi:hypothetical protein
MGLDKDNMLLLSGGDPQDKVRIRATFLRKADSASPAQVAQQEHLCLGQ